MTNLEIDWRRINREAVVYTGERFDEDGTPLSFVGRGGWYRDERIAELETALRAARTELCRWGTGDIHPTTKIGYTAFGKALADIDKVLEGS